MTKRKGKLFERRAKALVDRNAHYMRYVHEEYGYAPTVEAIRRAMLRAERQGYKRGLGDREKAVDEAVALERRSELLAQKGEDW